ncbi:hypothetical protein HAX54_002245, partial [Datura stramonium]|nr:hypothetical protein [Datura stramonium]
MQKLMLSVALSTMKLKNHLPQPTPKKGNLTIHVLYQRGTFFHSSARPDAHLIYKPLISQLLTRMRHIGHEPHVSQLLAQILTLGMTTHIQ